MSETSVKSKLPSIEFKNAELPVLTAMLRDCNPARLADELHVRYGGLGDFFNQELIVLNFSALSDLPDQIDWPGMIALFRRFKTQAFAVDQLPEQHITEAMKHGFRRLNEASQPQKSKPVDAAEATVATLAPEPEPICQQPLILDRMLRSGQQIYAEGRDLIVIGGVSPGAEIIADGSIHCYGPLRGRALAGAKGNTEARIITSNFGPELVSVAGIYRTFEKGIPQQVAAKAAQVRLLSNNGNNELKLQTIDL